MMRRGPKFKTLGRTVAAATQGKKPRGGQNLEGGPAIGFGGLEDKISPGGGGI